MVNKRRFSRRVEATMQAVQQPRTGYRRGQRLLRVGYRSGWTRIGSLRPPAHLWATREFFPRPVDFVRGDPAERGSGIAGAVGVVRGGDGWLEGGVRAHEPRREADGWAARRAGQAAQHEARPGSVRASRFPEAVRGYGRDPSARDRAHGASRDRRGEGAPGIHGAETHERREPRAERSP